jgi:hypothetical protein
LKEKVLLRLLGSLYRDWMLCQYKKGIVKKILRRLPVQIFDKVRKFYLGDYGKKN